MTPTLYNQALTKLTITAYSDRDLTKEVGMIRARFNPDSLQLSYATTYSSEDFINDTVLSNNYTKTEPGDLALDLVYDDRMGKGGASIENQLTALRQLCYTVDPSRGEPRFLKVQWGNMRWARNGYFAGRMTALSFHYSLFDRDGTPLHATASLTIKADESIGKQEAEQNLLSPPGLVISVPAGPTNLALMAATASTFLVGGINYLDLAWSNDLDNLDDTKPGETLVAPAQSGEQS
ncbi:hypothetical protein SAMN05660489_04876 [Pseudomonas sp. LAMO17WK12:I10]|nr:hypothetical protein H160_04801 [Pseudomonas sp. LAMO17WK12:I9]SNY48407.1 hypothetical protein SAMN05660489_04876 [Pseudomonas sp. LAMO17WK12:I10]